MKMSDEVQIVEYGRPLRVKPHSLRLFTKIPIVVQNVEFIPNIGTPESVGLDLQITEGRRIWPKTVERFSTGIRLGIPLGIAGLILPRSGLASKHGITLANSPALIDPDFTGIVEIALYNRSEKMYAVEAGQKVAQILFVPAFSVTFDIVDELPETERGPGGFGSTGR